MPPALPSRISWSAPSWRAACMSAAVCTCTAFHTGKPVRHRTPETISAVSLPCSCITSSGTCFSTCAMCSGVSLTNTPTVAMLRLLAFTSCSAVSGEIVRRNPDDKIMPRYSGWSSLQNATSSSRRIPQNLIFIRPPAAGAAFRQYHRYASAFLRSAPHLLPAAAPFAYRHCSGYRFPIQTLPAPVQRVSALPRCPY